MASLLAFMSIFLNKGSCIFIFSNLRTKLCDICFYKRGSLNRDQLIRELRQIARQTGATLVIDKKAGKGSHYKVWYNGKKSLLMSRDMKPEEVRAIRKQLGIE